MPQAVILAGGEGSRLFPMTTWTPKPLLPVQGVPIVVHILRKLRAEGWTEVVLCINEAHREEFSYHLAHEAVGEMLVRLSTHPKSEEIGTAGELVTAARFLKEPYFLVYYGDILARAVTSFIRSAFEAMPDPKPAAILAVSSRLRTDKGLISLLPETNQVTAVMEKPLLNLFNLMGIDLFRRDVLEKMEVGEDLHRDVVPRLIAQGEVVRAYVYDDEFLDIGSVDSYRRAQTWRA